MSMVVWKKLGEVCQVLNGFAFKSSEYVPKGIRIIRISDVQNGYISDKDKVFYPIEKLSEFERYLLNNGDLVMSLTGNPGRVAFIRNESCALNQRVACLRAKTVSNSYLFYLFNCKEFESTAFANSTGGAQKNLSTTWLNNYLIPIPSLSEQTRIVGILDTFTASIENLKEQIAQRRKQYEYYRDQLLDLEGKPGVEMKTLGELSYKISSGRNKNKEDQGQYPVFGSTGIIAYTNSYLFDKPLILVARVGANAGYVYMINEKCDVTDNTLLVETKEDNNRKFIYYYLVYMNINQFAKGGGQPLITGGLLKDLLIPLPPLQEQQRIVSILDTFEASIQNLEAQLEQREKQYEYYRNQLLTFE